MLSAQYAKVLSDVLSSKTRTILIVLSIMAGLVAVGTVLSARTLLSEAVDASYGSINFNNASLVTAQSFEKDFVHSFDNNNLGVEAVDGQRSLSTRAVNTANKKTNITISSKVDYGDMRVNTISSKTGQWPPSRHTILVEPASLAVLGVREGDEIQIETTDKKLRTLKIAGTVTDLSSPPASITGMGTAYVDEETLEWLGAPRGYNAIRFTVQKEYRSSVVETP
jgi:putative ABC transport system permease protein